MAGAGYLDATILDPPLDWRVLLFTEALAVAVTLIAGLIPALHTTNLNMSNALKEGGREAAAALGPINFADPWWWLRLHWRWSR